MKKLILSLGDVPGTGRTTVCEAIQSLWQHRGLEHFRCHTADNQPAGPGVSRLINWRDQFSLDELIGWLEAAPLILLDAATGETDEVLADLASGEFLEVLMEMSCSLTIVTSVTAHRQTEAVLLKIAEQLRDDAEYVVVRSGSNEEPPSQGWQLPSCQRAMHHLDGVEITMPAWPQALKAMDGTELPHVLRLLAGEARLPRMVQSWLRSWWLECGENLGAAGHALWPAGAEAASAKNAPGSAGRSAYGKTAWA